MKRIFWLLLLLLISCGPSPEQMFKTAEFELLQTNYLHATKLYEQIIEKYPESELAETSRARLQEIKERLAQDAAGQGN